MTSATGLTTGRVVVTCAVTFVVSQILSIVIHGFVLAKDYAPFYGTLLRPMNQTADWRMLLLPVSHLSFVIAFIWVFARIAPRGPWFVRG